MNTERLIRREVSLLCTALSLMLMEVNIHAGEPVPIHVERIIMQLTTNLTLRQVRVVQIPLGEQQMLSSPLVLVGNTVRLESKGITRLQPNPIEVERWQVIVENNVVLHGDSPGKRVVVGGLFTFTNPANIPRVQMPEEGKQCVFFLRTNEKGAFLPQKVDDFAFAIEKCPENAEFCGLTLRESLRLIGHANITNTGIVATLTWLDLIGRIYEEDKDKPLMEKYTRDSRLPVRGLALAILLGKGNSNVLTDAVEYVEATWEGEATRLNGSNQRAIAIAISRLCGPNVVNKLRPLLKSSAPEIARAAVEALRYSADKTCIKDLAEYLAKTTDRGEQYNCLTALSRVAELKVPAYSVFMDNPGKYLKTWNDWWSEHKQQYEVHEDPTSPR
ncbi:MAG: hypothetical protein PCFJNLEI_03522 [Verrucomicrobiae bacterium]|nr:hypothetical protein [Verrucomicrobiae bacterium]